MPGLNLLLPLLTTPNATPRAGGACARCIGPTGGFAGAAPVPAEPRRVMGEGPAGCPAPAAACGGALTTLGAFQRTKVPEFTWEVPGLAAALEGSLHLVVLHLHLGSARGRRRGVPARLFELFDPREYFNPSLL